MMMLEDDGQQLPSETVLDVKVKSTSSPPSLDETEAVRLGGGAPSRLTVDAPSIIDDTMEPLSRQIIAQKTVSIDSYEATDASLVQGTATTANGENTAIDTLTDRCNRASIQGTDRSSLQSVERLSLEDDDSFSYMDGASLTVLSGDGTDAATAGRYRIQSRKRNRSLSNTITFNDLEAGRMEDDGIESPSLLPNPRSSEATEDNQSVDTVDALLETLRELSRNVPAAATSTSNNATGSNSEDDATPASEGPAPYTPTSCCALCLTRLLCIPLVLIISISTVIVVVLLVLIPGLLFLAVSVGFYYCCTRDAIPLRVLIQAMLWDAESDNGSASAGGAAARLSAEEIQAALIRRTCLAVVPRLETSVASTPAAPLVDPEIQGAADYIVVHDHFTYYFSKPFHSDLDGLSHRGVQIDHSGVAIDGTAGLDTLLESMNARHATSTSWTDTDDDIASDRAVIQRHSRPRRLGHGTSSRQTSEQQGIEMQATPTRSPATTDTETSAIQPTISLALRNQAEPFYEQGPLDVNTISPPLRDYQRNVISTITESLDEVGSESNQNFDDVWDTVSLASNRHHGLVRALPILEDKVAAGKQADAIDAVPAEPETTSTAPLKEYPNELQSETQQQDGADEIVMSPGTNDDVTQNENGKNGKDDDESCCASVLQRGIACDICLIHYKVGDLLAWSNNPACSHVFHSDCITDWMQRNHHCPNCRSDFLFYEHYKKQIMKQHFPVISVETPSPAAPPTHAEVHL